MVGTCVIILRCDPAATTCQCRCRGAVALIKLPKGLVPWGIIPPPLQKLLWVLWLERTAGMKALQTIFIFFPLPTVCYLMVHQEHFRPHPRGMPASLDKARPLVGSPFPSLLFCCPEGCMEPRLIFPVQMGISSVIQQAKSKTRTVVIFWVLSYAASHMECSSFHLSLYVFKYTRFSSSLLTDAHICLMLLNTRVLPAALTAWFLWLWNALSSCVSQTLDYETKKSYSLKVEAANVHIDPKFISNGPFKDTVTVKIAVEDADEPPVFLKPSYIFEVQENAASGTVVGKVHAKDPDAANSAIRFAAFPVSFWALAFGVVRQVLKTVWQIYRHPEYWNFNRPALVLCLHSINCQFLKACIIL